jgi:hypothetical protein
MTTENIILGIGSEKPTHENPPEQETPQSEGTIDNQGNPVIVPSDHTPGDPGGPNQGQ